MLITPILIVLEENSKVLTRQDPSSKGSSHKVLEDLLADGSSLEEDEVNILLVDDGRT